MCGKLHGKNIFKTYLLLPVDSTCVKMVATSKSVEFGMKKINKNLQENSLKMLATQSLFL